MVEVWKGKLIKQCSMCQSSGDVLCDMIIKRCREVLLCTYCMRGNIGDNNIW